MRPKFPEDLFGINESARGDISFRLAESFMQRCTVSFITPVARIQREQFYFSSVREVGGFVHQKSSLSDTSLDSHVKERSTRRAAQQGVATDAGFAGSLARCGRSARLNAKPLCGYGGR